MMVKVLDDGDESEAFPVTSGVKQGCDLAPTLFSMVISAMLTDAFHDCQDGLHIRFRADGGLFNLRRLKAVTKVKETAENFCLLTTVPPTPAQSRRCNRKWTTFQEPATTLVSS